MGKVIPTTSFRRAARPDPAVVEAFVRLDDAPINPPAPSAEEQGGALASTSIASTAAAIAAISPTAPPATTPPAQTPPPLASEPPPASQAKWRRKTVLRADGRELRKQTIYLDAETSHRLKVVCAERQYDVSEAIAEAVGLWLSALAR